MSLPKDMGERGKEKERDRGARPKVRQSRSEERRESGGGGRKGGGRGKKKGLPSQGVVTERPVSDGFEYGEQLGGLAREAGSSSPTRERRRWPGLGSSDRGGGVWPGQAVTYGISLSELPTTQELEAVKAGGGSGSSSNSSSSRTLRQKIQDAVGQCFPIKSHNAGSSTHIFSPSTSAVISSSSSSTSTSTSSSFSSSSSLSAVSRRKIHLSELMLDSCPFPADSELAQKWYLIKQHTAPISQPPLLESSPSLTNFVDLGAGACGAAGTAAACATSGAVEDEDDLLRERRRISIEQGVEPPPNAQIHTFEVTAEINPLYKLGPKLAHGMNELAGDERATLQQQQQQQQQLLLQRQQQQHQLLLQSCLDTLDEVANSSSSSCSTAAAGAGVTSSTSPCSASTTLVAAAAAAGASSDLTLGSEATKRPMSSSGISDGNTASTKPAKERFRVHTQIDYIHCLVPDLLQITNLPCYWGVMDRYQAEALLEGKPEGTFLLRDSAQEDYLFSVSFRRYGRSLHARIEQWNHNFSFDVHDPSVFHAPTVTGLLEHYKDPNSCMFFEPLLSTPVHRTQPFSLQHICRAVISNHTSYDGISALPIPSALKEHLKEYHYKQRVRVRRLDTWWE